MHVNTCTIVGRVSAKGPQLRYADNRTPYCSLVVEVDELGKSGEVFTTWLPVEVTGKYAEQTSVDLEAGDEVMISGKLKYKSVVDQRTQQKTSKLIVSTWGISQRTPAHSPHVARSATGEGGESGNEPGHAPEPKKGRAKYPKWKPEPVASN